MRKIGIIIMLLASVACGDEVSNLRAENASLKHENAQLKKIVAKLAPASAEPISKPEKPAEPAELKPVKYRGKVRPEYWVKEQYEKFKDKIVLVDGKYYDIGKDLLEEKPISRAILRPGNARLASGRITDPETGDAETSDGVKFRVVGIENLKAGQGVPEWLVSCGTKDRRVVYQPVRSLTETEFREALESGLMLIEWKKEKKWYSHGTKVKGKSWLTKDVYTKTVVK